MAESGSGRPCARTLLLLYAADLAFRLRWEIRPALAAGRLVIAAPYVDTAIAFGRAAGMDAGWLSDLFSFAMTPGRYISVNAAAARTVAERRGFLEFGIQQAVGAHASAARLELIRRATLHLKSLARLHVIAARKQGRVDAADRLLAKRRRRDITGRAGKPRRGGAA
jgi:hypothetical protein